MTDHGGDSGMANLEQPDRSEPGSRSSRFWLYAPLVLLTLVAAAWTAAWFVIRNRTGAALDTWLATERAAGRQWTCADRAIGGFPFRVEISCATLGFERDGLKASFGRVLSVAQVYQPRHIIAEIAGPLRATQGGAAVEGRWSLLQASIQSTPEALQRASVVFDEPTFRLTGIAPVELAFSGDHLEAHLRPDPARARGEGAIDVALSAAKVAAPLLDEWIGGTEPADIDLETTVTQAGAIAGLPFFEKVERWRQAGGIIDLTRLALRKGARRLEARGELALDDLHRPRGRLEVAASGLEGLLGAAAGGRAGTAAAILGAFTARPTPGPGSSGPPPAGTPAPGPTPLPPLRMENGRLSLGPFSVPGVRLPALY